MGEVSIIGLDLAKNVFQAHGAATDGSVVFRRKLSRAQLLRFLADQPPCVVAMEACGSASYWAREMVRLGHEVRLIAPQYVRAFVKRQKNDAADAEAIVVAAQRPEMRFVEPKSEDQQACAVLFRARERLLHQRTELVNALRSVLYEYGHVFPKGIAHLRRIEAVLTDPASDLPALVRDECHDLLEQTPAGRMMMKMVGGLAEFEGALIRERTSAGLEAARTQGRVGERRSNETCQIVSGFWPYRLTSVGRRSRARSPSSRWQADLREGHGEGLEGAPPRPMLRSE